MFHLVYVSSASKAFTAADLKELLRKARAKNGKLGVTGMLLYKGGNFMQILEGEVENVEKLARTIEGDPRHKGVLFLLRGTSEARLFPDWSMGFHDITKLDGDRVPGYNDFMNTPLTSAEFSQDLHRCRRLLLLFKKKM